MKLRSFPANCSQMLSTVGVTRHRPTLEADDAGPDAFFVSDLFSGEQGLLHDEALEQLSFLSVSQVALLAHPLWFAALCALLAANSGYK